MLLLDLLAPPRCLGCGAPRGDPLCAGCRAGLPWLRDPCPRCALPRPCGPCPARRAPFASAWAPVAHAGVARELVLALKLRGSRSAADAMAAAMAARIEASTDTAIVPVPASPERRRARGYDPAAMLARRLARRTEMPLDPCLRRAPGAARHVGRTRGHRAGAPLIVTTRQPPPDVVLVDDVHTTGRTLEACAEALKDAGARRIAVITYARTLRGA
jgi:predicted amidophosphoribosyltransferase